MYWFHSVDKVAEALTKANIEFDTELTYYYESRGSVLVVRANGRPIAEVTVQTDNEETEEQCDPYICIEPADEDGDVGYGPITIPIAEADSLSHAITEIKKLIDNPTTSS